MVASTAGADGGGQKWTDLGAVSKAVYRADQG